MKERRGRMKWVIIAVAALAVLAGIVVCGIAILSVSRYEQARAQFAPPTVYVTQPDTGTSIPAGRSISVSATAVSSSPITGAELWMDGALVQTQDSDSPAGISPFFAHFRVPVKEGIHLLIVRATNSAGITGQSMPVTVVGGPDEGPGRGFVAVNVGEGQTLDDLADAYGIEPQALQFYNPDLQGRQPPVGSQVVVPAPTLEPTPSITPTAAPGLATPTPTASPSPAPPSSAGVTATPGGDSTSPGASGGGGSGSAPSGPPLQIIPPAQLPGGVNLIPAIPSFLPPAAPTNLQATVNNCRIRLQWKDNAWNEMRYEVWLAAPASPSRLIYTLKPAPGGTAWFEFPAPGPGDFTVWVEAANIVGSQPSNIAAVQVSASCPFTLSDQMQVELLDMTSQENEDRVYCYVSFEGSPEVRLPPDDSTFIQLQSGQTSLTNLESGKQRFTVPVPRDDVLEIDGECWGWAGGTLSKLGSFKGTTSSAQWTGNRLVLTGDTYEIGYAVNQGGGDGEGKVTTFGYEDPTMPPPYDLQVITVKSMIPGAKATTKLIWSWSGKESVTGFVVYLDGKAYKTVPGASARAAEIFMPVCGRKYRWQVAAVAGETNSRPSAEYVSTTPDCPVYVDVEFVRIHFKCVENYWFHWTCPNCGEVDTWFDLYVNDEWAGSGSENWKMGITCGTYDMQKLYYWGDPKWAKVRVKLSGIDPSITIRSRFYYINRWGEQTTFQDATRTISMPLDKWRTYKVEFPMEVKANGVWSKLTVSVDAVEGGSTL